MSSSLSSFFFSLSKPPLKGKDTATIFSSPLFRTARAPEEVSGMILLSFPRSHAAKKKVLLEVGEEIGDLSSPPLFSPLFGID